MAARPYAQMLASVLESLKRRIEIIDPETGELRHPLSGRGEEKRVLLVVVSGDKGFAGAFNATSSRRHSSSSIARATSRSMSNR